jgi:two-component system, OmpR family, sensor histidine kinase CpxA
VAGQAGDPVRRVFLTMLLWFSLTLLSVGLVFVLISAQQGFGWRLMWRSTFHNAAVFLIIGGIFCWVISSYLTKPLDRLARAAASIAEGHLDTRVDASVKNRRDEIAELARNFDRMAERIETLVTGQRRLLGDVSHELRSPLARLTVALGLVRQGPAEEAVENLERIGVEARRLDTLIGQLLTLTRIDSGADRGSAVRFDLTNLVQEIASDADFEALSRGRRVTITQADACMIEGFEELMRSAVENVVRNAVRHTAEGTAVEIALHRGSQIRLSVRDHGPGVPDSMLADIFLPFRRVTLGTNGMDNYDGAGLGLAIAQRAVGVHRGTIGAANVTEGGGLLVEIVLAQT